MAYRILLAPDKFKGSLTSFEVCNALDKGLRMARPDIEVMHLPMADGGEGWLELIAHYTQGKEIPLEVSNPLFQSVKATWLLSPDGNNAFVEMAKASGLQLLTPSSYDPVHASTFGTGQLIKAAVKSGAKNVYIGVGGSATNDGGIGMAAALGYKFLDDSGKELLPIGGNLIHISKVDSRSKIDFKETQFVVATDVKNPLYGEKGATRIYGPQKGADADMVEELENGMHNYSEVLKRELGIDLSNAEGAGAAGGLAAGCIAFLNASIQPGFELLWDFAKGEQQIKDCNLIVTGEGKVDQQTLSGKVVAGMAGKSKQFQKKLILICGSLELSPQELNTLGISSAYSIMNNSISFEEAFKEAPKLVEKIGYEIGSGLG